MRYAMGVWVGFLVTAFLGALNTFMAVSTGSPVSWAATYFITACCTIQLVSYAKMR